MVLVHCLLTDDDSSAFSLRLRTNEVCFRAHSARCTHGRHGTGERTQLEESGPRSWWLMEIGSYARSGCEMRAHVLVYLSESRLK